MFNLVENIVDHMCEWPGHNDIRWKTVKTLDRLVQRPSLQWNDVGYIMSKAVCKA